MKKNQSGFTIIELLVVVAIIGLISSIAMVALADARLRAQYTKVHTDIRQLANLAIVAKGQTSQTFFEITTATGVGTHSPCVSAGDLRVLARSHACWTNYIAAITSLNSATNGSYTISSTNPPADPWNSPYIFDENEGETMAGGPCHTDSIASAGPNGLYYDSDDVVYNIIETKCTPSVGPNQPNINW